MSEKKCLIEMEILYMALADKTRLRILNLMRDRGEVCVCFLVDVLGESQPKISRHLASLRSAGIVEARRDGKWIHYKITAPKSVYAAAAVKTTLDWLNSSEEMQAEYNKLAEIFAAKENHSDAPHAPKLNVSVSTHMKDYKRAEIETFLL